MAKTPPPFFQQGLKVDRAINDLRRGFAVKLETMLVFAADTFSDAMLDYFYPIAGSHASLVLSTNRVKALFPDAPQGAAKIKLHWPEDKEKLYLLSGLVQPLAPGGAEPPLPASLLDNAALALVKLAELIPAAIVLPFDNDESHLISLTCADIEAYKTEQTALNEVCTAPLCLEGAEEASIRVYRPALGGHEHYAIIIGKALETPTPLVRIHSSCYTGDLLRSLRCDCGDQLHEAIRFMGSQDEGGIVIYLMQEGRGIGLTNKLRTYDMQAHGLDTVEANEILGFEDDERLFLPAVKILEHLHLKTIRLLTNNPKKAKGLEEYGITVSACVPHVMQAQKHNEAYLDTKAKRLGHHLP